MNPIVRLAALTKPRSVMFPVRVALVKKLKELGTTPSTPYAPLSADEPRDVTCAVSHIVSYVEKTIDPRSVDISTRDYDQQHAAAANRFEDIRQLAATLQIKMEESTTPKTVVFEPKPVSSALVAAQPEEPVLEVAVEPEPEKVEPEPVVEEPKPAKPSVLDVPLTEIALDQSTRSRLETAMESLGDSAPKTVNELLAFAEENDPVDLPGLGRVSWRKVQEAMAEALSL